MPNKAASAMVKVLFPSLGLLFTIYGYQATRVNYTINPKRPSQSRSGASSVLLVDPDHISLRNPIVQRSLFPVKSNHQIPDQENDAGQEFTDGFPQ